MEKQTTKNLLFRSSHMMILISYTMFTLILTAESILLGWEAWAVILALIGVLFGWIIHIQQRIPEVTRIWIYSILMMATYFFYGSHATSTFDLATVMSAVIILYTMTGMKSLIVLNQVTYYITMTYALSTLYLSGEKFDPLVISRILLHLALIFMVGWVSRTIIDKWDEVLLKSEDEIVVLRDATTRLNDFLANVSHEIRTPINAVIGLTGVCIEKEDNEEIETDLHSIREAGRKVAEQISDILDYSEIDSRRLANNNEDYMLSSVLHDLVTELRPYKRDDIEMIIDVAPSVPSMMNTDVSKLKKILWHLIMNGIKYTKQGGVYVRIFSLEEPYGVNLCIEVRDTGIGMSEEQTERITEGFYQANSGRDRSSSGLGLGMSIVKGFVDALGGFVFVESRLGKGTAVHVSIPQKVVDPEGCMSLNNKEKLCIGAFLQFEKYENPEVREYYNMMVRNIVKGLHVQMHWAGNLESLKKLDESVRLTHLFVAMEEYETDPAFMEELAKKMVVSVVANGSFSLPKNSNAKIMEKPFYCFPVCIVLNTDRESLNRSEKQMRLETVRALVVDDEPMNLTVARGIFKQYGMTVKTADSGQESIDMCSQEDFDIVFMDHMMPGMDGVEAMKRIRSLRRDLPVVALTANAVSTAKEMFIREGFAGFVSKPVELAELERVLKAVLPASKITYVEKAEEKVKQPAEKESPESASEETEEDENAVLSKAGVDTATGLRYSQNDSDFYRELMAQYVTESAEKTESIEKTFASRNFKDYAIFVHALKSTSKMIGAVSLSEKAKEMEELAKAGGDSITDEMHTRLLTGYKDVVAAIASYLHRDTEPGAGKTGEDALEFSPDGGGEDETLEFTPENGGTDEALEFKPEDGGSDDVLEFSPED